MTRCAALTLALLCTLGCRRPSSDRTVVKSTKPLQQTTASVASPAVKDDPSVRRKVLESGVTYLSKQYPTTGRAFSLSLVVRAGNLSERPGEQEYAHLIEHLAFHGTRSFPRVEQERLFREAGIALGSGLGAWTQDELTYFSLSLPSPESGKASERIVKKAVALLGEWASAIRFDPASVTKAHSIVRKEAQQAAEEGSFRRATFQHVLQGSAYAEWAARPNAADIERPSERRLKAFYERWYHPTNLAVVAVGQFDEVQLDEYVRTAFGALRRAREEGAHLGKIEVPVKPGTHLTSLHLASAEPQVRLALVQPANSRNDEEIYRNELLDAALQVLLMKRQASWAAGPSSPIRNALEGFDMALPRQTTSLQLSVGVQGHRFAEVVQLLLRELHGLELSPPSDAEVNSALSLLSSSLASRPSTSTPEQEGYRLVRAFALDEPAMSPRSERELKHRLLSELSAKEIRQRLRLWLSSGGRHVLAVGPSAASLPSQQRLSQIVHQVRLERPEPPSSLDPIVQLMPSVPTSGTIAARAELESIGAYRWTLGNGATVLFKPSPGPDLYLHAFSPGGLAQGGTLDPTTLRLAAGGVAAAGLGDHRPLESSFFLAARDVHLQPSIDVYEDSLRGRASTNERETLLQALHLMMRSPGKDRNGFERYVEQVRGKLLGATPFRPGFYAAINTKLWAGNPLYSKLQARSVARISFPQARSFYLERFGDVGDFKFIFVGAAELGDMEQLIARYVASLPGSSRDDTSPQPVVLQRSGITTVRLTGSTKSTSTIYIEYHGPSTLSSHDRMLLQLLPLVLRERLNDSIRNDLGETYNVKTWSRVAPAPLNRYVVGFEFECQPGREAELRNAALAVVTSLREQGPPRGDVLAIQQTWNRAAGNHTPSFWLSELAAAERFQRDPNRILSTWRSISSLTAEELRSAARRFLDPTQYVDAEWRATL